MKYTLILLILSSSLSHACIVGPREIADGSEKGFFVETEQNKFCDNCIDLIAEAPLAYEGSPYSHALLSVYLDSKLVSKTFLASEGSSKKPEFYSIISSEAGISYELEILYGSGRCSVSKYVHQSRSSGT
jgi:hypothetical protein